MSATRNRTDCQDVTIQELTTDLERSKVYLTFHFVTVEFDYMTGMEFAAQLKAACQRIAPTLSGKSTPDLKHGK